MKLSRTWVQHISNPLHVYCRLLDFGLSKKFSRRLTIFYEKYLYCSIFNKNGRN